MEDLVTLSIGLGLTVSLLFSEMLGIAAGGMVVPGYIALYLHNPAMIAVTLVISFVTYFVVHSISSVVILYGRRRTVLMILVGFLLGWFVRSTGTLDTSLGALDLNLVGYIIPGLIAIWIDRQGVVETFSALITASVITRLGLILITGGEFSV